MCGIVGVLGTGPVAGAIVDALKRLEYRGYDSAGVATLENGRLARRRAEGKLKNLEAKLAAAPLTGSIGIGHTRWATHGKPTETNAHPHASPRLAVVHNGIIENFKALREELAAKGYVFATETDSEIAAFVVENELEGGKTPPEAVHAALRRMRGAFALVYLFEGKDDLLIGARQGAPLAVGYGEGETYLGSDALALAPFTDRIAYLEEGDWVVATRSGADIRDASGARVERRIQRSHAGSLLAEKGNYRHFMAKEIHEQPEVVGHTLAHYVDMAAMRLKPFDWPVDPKALARISIVGCGTAYMAGLIGKYWIERFARLPVEIDVASEYRYRETPVDSNDLTIVISQSGETADTLASLKYVKEAGSRTVGVVNVPDSSIARLTDAAAPTLAGPEIGVASTKAFTCQLAAIAALAIGLGRARGTIGEGREAALLAELVATPGLLAEALKLEPAAEKLAHAIAHARDVLYLGRGTAYPLAMEGALKLKELSYIHAEGYAAGELKHGPIALIDEEMPVVVLAPRDAVFEKTVSNMQEVAARGGRIILIGERRAAEEAAVAVEHFLAMPDMGTNFAPIVYAAPIQMLAYHTAVIMGKDADQPRNLAKSVTVE
ncbi:MAG TPA: glutamine--fructose-6-phosphate transaminase (isomerizing) [Roseiarcus sp.]|jgi:glucosamine--fructose-6-phosphate aminotransferase (isomerizing)|nr:glutamine--fructose-6-phosphate transaminase (isomerizing) [Roseiarcus sp.]